MILASALRLAEANGWTQAGFEPTDGSVDATRILQRRVRQLPIPVRRFS